MGLVSRTTAARIAETVPDLMRPSWLTETWSGTFGRGGLTARVQEAESTLQMGVDALQGSSSATGWISKAREQVGDFTRDNMLHPSGRLEVHHSYLELDGDAQGTGFARAFNEQAFARYAEAGVDDVTILAALDVGGYAWARQGFELEAHGAADGERTLQRARTIRNIVIGARDDGNISTREFASVRGRLVSAGGRLPANPLASVQELAALPIGRQVLLGTAWDGVREIERTQPWWAGRLAGSSAATDAAEGLSHLTHATAVTKRTADASRAVAAVLPEPLDPFAASRAFERNLGARIDPERSFTRLHLSGRDQVTDVRSEHKLLLPDGREQSILVVAKSDGAVVGFDHSRGDRSLRLRLNQAWRDLGVTSVRDDDTRALRTVRL